jgi:hypothetical protein
MLRSAPVLVEEIPTKSADVIPMPSASTEIVAAVRRGTCAAFAAASLPGPPPRAAIA